MAVAEDTILTHWPFGIDSFIKQLASEIGMFAQPAGVKNLLALHRRRVLQSRCKALTIAACSAALDQSSAAAYAALASSCAGAQLHACSP